MGIYKERLCKMCVTPIDPEHPKAKFCNSCRAKLHTMQYRNMINNRKAQHHGAEFRSKAVQKEKYTGPSIREINERAKELGITYGKYVQKYGSVIV